MGALNFDDFIFNSFKMGDERIFEVIFKAYYNQLVGFNNQFIRNKEEAKNITQEAFVLLWQNKSKVETKNGIRAFLYTSSKTLCINFLRHKKMMSQYQIICISEMEVEILDSFNFNEFEFNELDELIEQSINELPERSKIVFIKSYVEGKKNMEIAEEMNISIKAVEANKARAKSHLKNKLSEYLPIAFIQLLINLS